MQNQVTDTDLNKYSIDQLLVSNDYLLHAVTYLIRRLEELKEAQVLYEWDLLRTASNKRAERLT